MITFFVIASLLLKATFVVSQQLPTSLSSSCSSTLKGLVTSPDTACLNLPLLLTYAVDQEKSIPKTLDVWLSGLCSNNNTCSNENISNVVGQIVNGCQQDFAAMDIDIASLQGKITSIAQMVYPTARKAVCLKDTSANQFCVTETFENIENVVGQVDLAHLDAETMKQIMQKLTSNASNLVCSDCVKEAYNLGMQNFPDQVSKAKQPFEQVCGASFVDGTEPSNIVSTAGQQSLAASNTNAAAGLKPSGSMGSGHLAGLAAVAFAAYFA